MIRALCAENQAESVVLARLRSCFGWHIVAAPVSEMVILSLICLVLGVSLVRLAPDRPSLQALVESTAGCLMIFGLVLIGSGLPLFR
jgi:hypothetical protein